MPTPGTLFGISSRITCSMPKSATGYYITDPVRNPVPSSRCIGLVKVFLTFNSPCRGLAIVNARNLSARSQQLQQKCNCVRADFLVAVLWWSQLQAGVSVLRFLVQFSFFSYVLLTRNEETPSVHPKNSTERKNPDARGMPTRLPYGRGLGVACFA
jgi:hypothetical protein